MQPYLFSMFHVQLCNSGVSGVTKTAWPTNPEIFIIQPFTEEKKAIPCSKGLL